MSNGFPEQFAALTGHPPFPWQRRLFDRFMEDRDDNVPASASIPTGLGKTSIIAVWLLGLASGSKLKLPRRLVYVVNRRTVVDQTTAEVERLRNCLTKPEKYAQPEHVAVLHDIADRLRKLSHSAGARGTSGIDDPLAISTLRGQFADNRQWSEDPSRPAVICGTVDMIGSRLLFSGYGVGFKGKPLHAGFLGQDALLVHDEAHLEPAFQELITKIECEQKRCGDFRPLRVMELTATTRSSNQENALTFTLDSDDEQHPVVLQRIAASKRLQLQPTTEDGKVAEQIARQALMHKDGDAAVLVFVRTIDDVKKVYDRLTHKKDGVAAEQVQLLTGTMRGKERDRMADPRRPDACRVFARFLKPPKPDAPENERWKTEPLLGTVYLVCTSAGEVGIDISADHMVCDLSTFENMAQRFGRVNRYGEPIGHVAQINVVHPSRFDDKDKLKEARQATLNLLLQLDGDASPKALGELMASLTEEDRAAAFSPPPTILPATDILFDAWALTTIREKMPGRPPVEPYLHGIAEWEPPRTSVVWRKEVKVLDTDTLRERYRPEDLLEDYPLKPHELLSDTTERVYKQLQQLVTDPKTSIKGERRQKALERSRKNAAASIWLIDDTGKVIVTTIGKLLSGDKKQVTRQLADSTVLLPPSVGGLAAGMLNGTSETADDVADITTGPGQRIRVHSDDADFQAKMAKAADMRRVRSIEPSADDDEEDEPPRWDWYQSFPLEGGRTARKPVAWQTHVDDVVNNAKRIVSALSLPPEIANAVIVAAELHDHGKRRERFQSTLGNRRYPQVMLAKSGRRGARLPETFRHEFASVLDAQTDERLNSLDDEMKDLVLHLIATHHGRARPHFSRDEAFDPERPSSDAQALVIETPRRFAQLQRKYGRWGLAYLESLLRAADWAGSANPSAYVDESENEK